MVCDARRTAFELVWTSCEGRFHERVTIVHNRPSLDVVGLLATSLDHSHRSRDRMARTITITDDDRGVRAQVVVEAATDRSAPRITSVHIDALNGTSITSADLLLIESVGLRLPVPAVDVTPAAALPPAAPKPKRAPARRPPREPAAAVPAQRATGTQRARGVVAGLTADAVLAAIKDVGTSPAVLCVRLGISKTSTEGWLRRLRADGKLPHTPFSRPRSSNG